MKLDCKAYIARVGQFTSDGDPIFWHFICSGKVPSFEIDGNGNVLYGGYTVEELRSISECYMSMGAEDG